MKTTDPSIGLSIDAEEWFHVPGREEYASPDRWNSLPASFPGALEKSLLLLDEGGWKATFFVLGWIALRFPAEVRRIAAEGHELACHGMEHGLVASMSPERFRDDVASAKSALQDVSGAEVRGFRAPCWSMPRARWPYEILAGEGFAYSSSRLCIPGLGGGRPDPETVEGVLELPALSSWRGLFAWPGGGTVALRVAPSRLLARARNRALAEGRPAIYWFHPWELDAEAPRAGGSLPFRWARYAGLSRLPRRLRELVPPGDRTLGGIADAVDGRRRNGHTAS